MHDGPLQLFLPPVCEWFRRTFGTPTPVQEQGWPAIAKGQNTLLFAPTGSGKTLAAFLACLDGLWRQDPIGHGVQVLYISPLKALNNDIHRNLQIPLQGVAAVAEEMGRALPIIEIAVRTGDTPAPERQRLIRHPPHVLITTPESLHLLLTSKALHRRRNPRALSKQARRISRSVARTLASDHGAAVCAHRFVRNPTSPGRGRALPRRARV
jgi:ATP-dependent Lhr-like helicase